MGNNDKKIITISREFGSGGRLIGKRLAEKLDVPFYDKQLLDRIAEESGFSKEMIKDAEMKAKNSFLYSLASAMGTSETGPVYKYRDGSLRVPAYISSSSSLW